MKSKLARQLQSRLTIEDKQFVNENPLRLHRDGYGLATALGIPIHTIVLKSST